jgi:DNA-binding NarL/FixJ family response regulator
LLKERVNEGGQLVSAIKLVANGGSVIDPKVVEELVSAKRRREHSPLNELTPRELEVLALVAEGRSNAAIAESLDLTKRAVEKHINSIFAKLDFQGGVAQQASQGHASVPQRDQTAARALAQVPRLAVGRTSRNRGAHTTIDPVRTSLRDARFSD